MLIDLGQLPPGLSVFASSWPVTSRYSGSDNCFELSLLYTFQESFSIRKKEDFILNLTGEIRFFVKGAGLWFLESPNSSGRGVPSDKAGMIDAVMSSLGSGG